MLTPGVWVAGSDSSIKTRGFIKDDEGNRVLAPEGVRVTTWQARTKFRDADGVVRLVERWASTKNKSENSLKAALVDREAPAGSQGGLRPAGTGVRLSEALECTRWADVDLKATDDNGQPAPNVHMRGAKTAMADRIIPLPPWLAERVRQRAVKRGACGLVFGSPRLHDKTKPRDRRNMIRHLRTRLDTAGMPWATFHTFRRPWQPAWTRRAPRWPRSPTSSATPT
jgi:integrase